MDNAFHKVEERDEKTAGNIIEVYSVITETTNVEEVFCNYAVVKYNPTKVEGAEYWGEQWPAPKRC